MLAVFLVFMIIVLSIRADVIENYKFINSQQQSQFFRLNKELRCPQCQNQSISNSNASIAIDLRRVVYQMIVDEGADDETIIQFMLNRYGEFILYKPRMNSKTVALWFSPLGLFLFGIFMIVQLLKQHKPDINTEVFNKIDKVELDKLLSGKDK